MWLLNMSSWVEYGRLMSSIWFSFTFFSIAPDVYGLESMDIVFGLLCSCMNTYRTREMYWTRQHTWSQPFFLQMNDKVGTWLGNGLYPKKKKKTEMHYLSHRSLLTFLQADLFPHCSSSSSSSYANTWSYFSSSSPPTLISSFSSSFISSEKYN